MSGRSGQLRADPVAPLLTLGEPTLARSARAELLGEDSDPASLRELPAVARALGRQRPDGSWKYLPRRARLRSRQDYDQLATYEALLPLVYPSTASMRATRPSAPPRSSCSVPDRGGRPPRHLRQPVHLSTPSAKDCLRGSQASSWTVPVWDRS